MTSDPEFRADLYRGTARFYDAFRVPYPRRLLADLLARAQVTGTGRLLDLACGTGQITFGLVRHFAEVWAVDQEPEAIAFARAKAMELGIRNVRWIAGRAEDVTADGSFELVAIGNAFHRLQRQRVAESAFGWIAPGGHLALLWSDSPWNGPAAWQRVLNQTARHWTREAEATGRVPASFGQAIADRPHTAVLAAAGFELAGAFEFTVPYEWTVRKLTGHMYSTSFLSREALGRHVQAFERDLRDRLTALQSDGTFHQEISFAYDLLRRPQADDR
jgi:ubiquinone/menaquinone biosynthesis C-methylase UbiE